MVELLIAMIIISLTMIPFFATMLWGQQRTELTVDRVTAENLALRFLEYLHGFKFEQITSELADHLTDTELFEPMEDFTVEPIFLPEDNTEVKITIDGTGPATEEVTVKVKYKIVKVNVTWTHQRKEKTLQIADIFVNYEQ